MTASATSNASSRASRCAPRDRATSASSARRSSRLPELRSQLACHRFAAARTDLNEQIGDHRQQQRLLEKAIVDSPPMLIRDGGVIAPGYDDELDDLRAIAENADQYLLDLERGSASAPASAR